MALGVVLAVVGLGREQDHQPKRIPRRGLELVGQEVDDLGRPQELVLEIDELLGLAQGARVGLEDPELAVGDPVIHALGDRPHDLHGVLPGLGHGRRLRSPVAGQLLPAQIEVRGDVGHRGTAQAGAHVVPAEAAPGLCAEVSKRSPARSVMSMPPTKASVPSMMIVFSWWQ